ncbi:MAG: hypothetical protein HY659_10830, partial [Rhizobiales bacterium]|nr:hypothetical protein [Hyphomicrobiales bacterium]
MCTLRRLRSFAIAAAVATCSLPAAVDLPTSPAFAQPASIDFRDELAPYGSWVQHPRWGEVWVPSRRPPDWRPYLVGHWVYTEEWGWYWAAEEEEELWGWITYHYGRWVFDPNLGWIWIPGDEWAPAWVTWRHGDDFVGWAALPPEELFDEDYNEPQPWLFVRYVDFVAPREVWRHVVPRQRVVFYIQRSNLVNRTYAMRNARFAVNPGMPPAFVARAVGRPLRTFAVQPRVLAGTAQINGAVVVRPGERRRDGDIRRQDRRQEQITIRQTSTTIAPAATIAPPEPLKKGEGGRLGERPPRAAQGVQPGAAGTTQQQQQQQQIPPGQQQQQQGSVPPLQQQQRIGPPPGLQQQQQQQQQQGSVPPSQQRQRIGPPPGLQQQQQQQQQGSVPPPQQQQRIG